MAEKTKYLGHRAKDLRAIVVSDGEREVRVVALSWKTGLYWDDAFRDPVAIKRDAFVVLVDTENGRCAQEPEGWDDPLLRAAHYLLLKHPEQYERSSFRMDLDPLEVKRMQSLWPAAEVVL